MLTIDQLPRLAKLAEMSAAASKLGRLTDPKLADDVNISDITAFIETYSPDKDTMDIVDPLLGEAFKGVELACREIMRKLGVEA